MGRGPLALVPGGALGDLGLMAKDTPSRIFDGALISVAITGALVAVATVVAVARGSAASDLGPSVQNLLVTLSEFAVKGDLVAEPGPVELAIDNAGTQLHNLRVEGGPLTADLPSGARTRLELGDLTPGSYTLFCSIPGHREAGMEATLTVGGGAGHADHRDPDYAALDKAMEESILKFPAPTEGKGNEPLEPRTLSDGTKEFNLVAEIVDWEVEPGIRVKAWTYNGMVPAPAIRVDVGDKVRINVKNELPMGTDVHFHGIPLPNNMDGVAPITQPLIKPGASFTYSFVAERSAVSMYHAHHHAQMQVPNGMFGTFIVGDLKLPLGQTISGFEIPSNLKIAAEIPMVLNDAGTIGLSLNGKSFPATEPYVFNEGDWILVHYYNEGLQIHPMHPHQFPMLAVAKDGIPLEHPYWSDTLTVAPGERYSVLMHLNRKGVWAWHCHILNHVERDEGMFGMVTALIVQ